ncbi:rhamnan synthesis F family protein [Mesorhizobium salmacidum]|uniref:Rhamnosyltransferase n=1 Tax=Mesorhizobium salmacidum TaxID=3015171 RepID=A0ABU8L6A3_9HYPH
MKRLAIAFHYDENGKVEDYYLHLLESLKPFVEHMIVVSNGFLDEESADRLSQIVDRLIVRENRGFDVWAYKAGLTDIGWERLADFDEVLLFNHTFYGPIFPFSEMFSRMDSEACDFWGISAHRAMRPHPFNSMKSELPFHLNSHFIAVRKPLHQSEAFKLYWQQMSRIDSYMDSIKKHETVFTKHFEDIGYRSSVYVDPDKYKTSYPVLMEVDKTIENRSPILKRRLFFQDTLFLDREAINLPRALYLIEKNSEYDLSLVWRSIGKVAKPRTLNSNSALMSVLSDEVAEVNMAEKPFRIAVIAHIFYPEMAGEMLAYVENIPAGYDLIVTTDTDEKKARIEVSMAGARGANRVIIHVVDSNDGRDTSALLISCRDYVLNGEYDLVCRVHSKKSPQDGAMGDQFKLHMLDNLLYSKAYVENIIRLFAENSAIGLVMPPIVHIGYPTMGNSWFGNKDNVALLAEELGLKIHLDDDMPVAPYGGMYWFRPLALRKLFAHEWKWSDFAGARHKDGSLPYAIERIVAYVALDAGYVFRHVLTPSHAARNYTMLEAKLSAFYSGQSPNFGVKSAFRVLVLALKRSTTRRSPFLFRILRPPYRAIIAVGNRLARKA